MGQRLKCTVYKAVRKHFPLEGLSLPSLLRQISCGSVQQVPQSDMPGESVLSCKQHNFLLHEKWIAKMKGTHGYWSLKTVTWRPTEVHSCHNRQPPLRWHRQQHGPGMKPCFQDLAPWLNRTQNFRLLTAYILTFRSLIKLFLGIQYALQKKHALFLWKKIILFNQVNSEKGQGSKTKQGFLIPGLQGWGWASRTQQRTYTEVLGGKASYVHTGREVAYKSALKMVPSPTPSQTVLSH